MDIIIIAIVMFLYICDRCEIGSTETKCVHHKTD